MVFQAFSRANLQQHRKTPIGQLRWSVGEFALLSSENDGSMALDHELTANWKHLECRLPPDLCAEFMWMYRQNGIDHYKHIVTRRYLRLDAAGRCLSFTDSSLTEVPFEDEWKRITGHRRRSETDDERS